MTASGRVRDWLRVQDTRRGVVRVDNGERLQGDIMKRREWRGDKSDQRDRSALISSGIVPLKRTERPTNRTASWPVPSCRLYLKVKEGCILWVSMRVQQCLPHAPYPTTTSFIHLQIGCSALPSLFLTSTMPSPLHSCSTTFLVPLREPRPKPFNIPSAPFAP
jgi:hypothetical protein